MHHLIRLCCRWKDVGFWLIHLHCIFLLTPHESDGQLQHLKCSTRRYCAVQTDSDPEPLTRPAQHSVRKVDEEGLSGA